MKIFIILLCLSFLACDGKTSSKSKGSGTTVNNSQTASETESPETKTSETQKNGKNEDPKRQDIGFSYPPFSEFNIKKILPQWTKEQTAKLNYRSDKTITGMSVEAQSGALSFDSLASFAKAGGETVQITALSADHKKWDTQVTLTLKAKDKSGLLYLIKLLMNNLEIGTEGNYNSIDVSDIQDMSNLLNTVKNFNGDISKWDTSKVANMKQMFAYSAFNGDISKWDTSKVTNMTQMFEGAKAFNGDISAWDVQAAHNNTNIEDKDGNKWKNGLSFIFRDATAFNNAHSSGATTEPEDYFNVLKNN